MRLVLILGVASILAGCAHDLARLEVICLPMKDYPAATQSAAASELEALPAGSVVAEFVADYGAMRAANRACLSGRPNPAD